MYNRKSRGELRLTPGCGLGFMCMGHSMISRTKYADYLKYFEKSV